MIRYSNYRLEDKVAIVTGATGVLGGAMAKGLAEAGAKVALLGRNEERAHQRADEIRAGDGEALPVLADVLEIEQLEKAREQVLSSWGRIDILVNAAGGNIPEATVSPNDTIFDISPRAIKEVMDLNFMGTLLPIQVFGKVMKEQKSGCIVNISSMATMNAITRVVGYSAAKAAVENYTKWLAVELALKVSDKIRVNAIAPGFFLSEQNKFLLFAEENMLTERGKKIISKTPMGRFGEPEELLSTLLWLCVDESDFVTGVVVPVDGGFSSFSGV